MTPGSRPGEAARAGDKKGESVDRGSLWEPGGLPWFHADPAPWLCVKSECSLLLCESELSVDQRITGPWRGRRALRECVVVVRTSPHETSSPGNHTAWGPPRDLLLPGRRSDETQGPRAGRPGPRPGESSRPLQGRCWD